MDLDNASLPIPNDTAAVQFIKGAQGGIESRFGSRGWGAATRRFSG
jgi:hypothetical protein